MPADLVGQRLGQYEIRALLGKGGMSSVYLAYQPAMDRVVAVKVLPREFLHDDTFLMRFQTEVRTIARLEHLHILPVYDVGEENGIPYYVMRYLPGGTLADLIERRLPDLPRVVQIVGQVADALDYAHERGIIHRDLKPSNVLLDSNGNAYLADFGIARVQEASTTLTGSQVIGTPPYVAPEMVRKGEPVTHAVDIYALGVITYQMLTGELPYYDPDPMKTLMMHALEPVPSLRDFDPNISPALDAVVRRCMAKRPQDRYPTAGAFARELALVAEGERPTVLAPAIREEQTAAAEVPTLPPQVGYQYVAYGPEAYGPEEEEGRRGVGSCLIVLGVFAALIAGVVLTAFILTDGHPLSLLTVLQTPPTRTPQPTVTPTFSLQGTALITPTGTGAPLEAPPAGGQLVFASNRDGDYEIYLIDADGGNVRQLTHNTALDFDPAWSPDGTQIVFASSVDGDPEITIMDADGSHVRQITQNADRDADPAWSPDGEWIAFTSDRDGDFELFLMRPDGSDVRQLTFNEVNDFSPAWSPDGTQIAYYVKVGDDASSAELYLLDVDSGASTRLTQNAVLDQWPDWSPDGTRLVFSSSQGLVDGRRALFEYNLRTGRITQLTSGLGHDDDAVWSPDGRYIAFDSDRDGSGLFNLYLLDLGSGNMQRLTSVAANDVTPAWRPRPFTP